MSYALSPELRQRFWRNQSPVVWLETEAKDRNLFALVRKMAASKAQEAGHEVALDPKHHRVAILTDAMGTPLAVVAMFADMLAWGYQLPDVGDGRDHLLNLIDMIQADRPELMASGDDPEVTSRLHHLLANNPERAPVAEETA